MKTKYQIGDGVRFNCYERKVKDGIIVGIKQIVPFLLTPNYRILYNDGYGNEEVRWVKEINILFKLEDKENEQESVE